MPNLKKWRLPLISMRTLFIFGVLLLINRMVNVTETFTDILKIIFSKPMLLNLRNVYCKELP